MYGSEYQIASFVSRRFRFISLLVKPVRLQARETNTAAEQLGRELAQEASGIGRARLAQDKRDARARGISLPEHRATAAAYEMAQNVGPEEVANLQRLIGAGIAPTQTLGQVQQAQAPQQVQQAAGFNQTDKTVNEELNTPENRDNQSNSVENLR